MNYYYKYGDLQFAMEGSIINDNFPYLVMLRSFTRGSFAMTYKPPMVSTEDAAETVGRRTRRTTVAAQDLAGCLPEQPSPGSVPRIQGGFEVASGKLT